MTSGPGQPINTIIGCVAVGASTWLAGSCAAAPTAPPVAGVERALIVAPAPAAEQAWHSGDLEQSRQRRLALAQSTLLHPSDEIDPAIRRTAAEELLAMSDDNAVGVLQAALQTDRAEVHSAVALALAADPDPPPALLDPLINALRLAPAATVEPLANAVTRYEGQALQRLADVALDHDVPEAERIGPILAMGAFRSRDSARLLVALLEPDAAAPPALTHAACRSLESLSGFPYGVDADRWRTWWSWAQDLPAEEWFKAIVHRLSQRMTELERELRQEQQRAHANGQRVLEAYSRLFPLLDPAAQAEELPRLLEDPIPALREYAISRVEVLLRANEVVPADVQAKLAERLTDATPVLRVRAAKALDVLSYPVLPDLVAAQLAGESDPAVLAALLDVAARRPTAAMVEPLRHLLGRADDISPAAARALWAVATAHGREVEGLDAAAHAITAIPEDQLTAEHARVLAVCAGPDDLPRTRRLLDHSDQTMRRYVAEGLAARGDVAALVERADDPVVYPFALRAIADAEPEADLDTLRDILALVPPSGQQPVWHDAILTVGADLAPADLAAADELLAVTSGVPRSVRVRLLARVGTISADALTTSMREALLTRLASLQLHEGLYDEAHRLLLGLNGQSVSAATEALRFRAAALARQFPAAAALRADPEAWLDLLEEAIEQHPAIAAALRDEIQTRFADADQLTAEQRSRLEKLAARITAADRPATADAADARTGG